MNYAHDWNCPTEGCIEKSQWLPEDYINMGLPKCINCDIDMVPTKHTIKRPNKFAYFNIIICMEYDHSGESGISETIDGITTISNIRISHLIRQAFPDIAIAIEHFTCNLAECCTSEDAIKLSRDQLDRLLSLPYPESEGSDFRLLVVN